MRELNDIETGLIAGGSGGVGYGTVPGFFKGGPEPKGPSYTHSFGNGWSLKLGSTTDGSAKGIGISYVWK